MALTKKQQYLKAHLEALDGFAGTAADYARLHDLNPKKLYVYKTKLHARQAASTPCASSFVQVQTATMRSPTSSDVMVALPNGLLI